MDAWDARQHFRSATEGFVAVLASLDDGSWDRPGLGVWTVRDLAGHTSRALSTVESYLASPDPSGAEPELADAVAYYRRAARTADPAAVADRGRAAGAALGGSPAESVASLASRVLPLVEAAADDAVVPTPMGTTPLDGYLMTRTFELVVHSLDLAAATGVAVPATLSRPLGACLHLAADLAAADGHGPDVLLALTGRRPLPHGFSVV